MSGIASQVHDGTVSHPPAMEEGAKTACDQNSAKLFNKEMYSDLLIRFSGRELRAHRFVVCQASDYFKKLCGPDSRFAESHMNEITLHDDDPDAVEAMIRHLYNFWLKPPSLSQSITEKVRFYCNVAVVSDKYALPALTDEAHKSLNTFVSSIEDPVTLVGSLKIITEDYNDIGSLDGCALKLAAARLTELAPIPEFLGWLPTQPHFFQELVQDAAKARASPFMALLASGAFKKIPRYKCADTGCKRYLANSRGKAPKCHDQVAQHDGYMYYLDD